MRRRELAGIAALALAVTTTIVAVVQDRAQRQLIASGACTASAEAWYQPPATNYCAWSNGDGMCMAWREHRPDPYLRTWWVCEGGKDFWRRKAHE